jgi:hypothetical protein
MADHCLTRVSFEAGVVRMQPLFLALVCVGMLIGSSHNSYAETGSSKIVVRDPANAELQQPTFLTPMPAKPRGEILQASATVTAPAKATTKKTKAPSTTQQPADSAKRPAPVDATSYSNLPEESRAQQADFQIPAQPPTTSPSAAPAPPSNKKDPCAGLINRPFSEFGINVAMPAGEFPNDFATQCWQPVNEAAGSLAGYRAWGTTSFAWDATSLCYRPLYFEEANLERYGYGCCETLQPAASAAHFFGTLPLLPYCMAVDCPGECIYTLGHYRPGSCNPKRYMWPPFSPRAVLAEGGVWTALVFIIP